jgi:catechol 2,3-dioxygenase-like lactoylglutathione lyase family enzyme
MTAMRLAAVALIVPDYDVAIRFFCDVLGFRLTSDLDQGHKRWVTVAARGGGSEIVLAKAEGPDQAAMTGAQAAGRVFLFLETGDFARDHARMLAAGVIFEEDPRREPYGTVAVWRDPFGNRWDLIERH